MFSVDSETHYRTELRYKRIFHIRIICTALPYYITRYRSWSTNLTTLFAHSNIYSSLHPVRDSTGICYGHDLKEKRARGKEMNSEDVQIPKFSLSRAGLKSSGLSACQISHLTQPIPLRLRLPMLLFSRRRNQAVWSRN
jgi:hypothetical protein